VKAWALLAGGLLAAAALRAGTGTSGEAFLLIPLMARPAGMAGADTALASGVEGLEYNPAALGGQDRWTLSADQISYAQGINLEDVAGGWGRAGYGCGLSVISFSTPQIAETSQSGAQIGTFGMQDIAVTGGGGGTWGPWSAGLNARVVSLSLAGYSEHGVETDLGLQCAPWDGVRLGLALQHLGTLSAASQQADPTPLTLRGGLGWQGSLGKGLWLAADSDLVGPNDASPQVLAGLELGWTLLYLRLGGAWSQDWYERQTSTLGAGFRLGQVRVDYAYSSLAGLGATQRIGISWSLGGAPAAAQSPAAPRGLQARAEGPDLVLTWDPVPGARGYWVYVRRGPGAALEKVGQAPLKAAHARLKRGALVDLGLAVSAVDADGRESPLGDEMRSLPGTRQPEAPTNLRVILVQRRRKLAWDYPKGDGSVRFQVLVAGQSGGPYTPVGKPLAGTEVFIGEATVRQEVYLAVKARLQSAAGPQDSALSNEIKVEPLR
jgi:hypothetical protein